MKTILRMMILKINTSLKGYRQLSGCLILLILLVLTSCVNKFTPVQQPGLLISDDYAIYKADGLILTVTEQMWGKDPQFLSDHYTTFWIKIQNNTTTPLLVEMNNFAILDQNRNQVDAQNPDQVLDLMLQDESLYIDRFIMSVENQQDRSQKRAQVQRNLTMDSFAFGEILPRASKQGYLFFPRISYNAKQITFVYKNKEIQFQRLK